MALSVLTRYGQRGYFLQKKMVGLHGQSDASDDGHKDVFVTPDGLETPIYAPECEPPIIVFDTTHPHTDVGIALYIAHSGPFC
jgi:hypothetical protein